uniref:Peptidase S1 domain-containing protein n=1 Tax=Anopheles maculatus TaxID=74869 RepID=A0A182T627_9DIPT
VLPSIVRLGDQSLLRQDDGAEPEDYDIQRFIVHPEFKWSAGKYNDLALIELSERVVFTNFIRPACLYTTDRLNVRTAIATGFGLTEDFGSKSDELRKVALNIYENDLCADRYRSNRHIRQGIRSTQMCVGDLAGGKDTCQGDSGGPLQVTREENQCMFYILGVTSFGQVCGSATPAIYTKVSAYLDWIESVVWE